MVAASKFVKRPYHSQNLLGKGKTKSNRAVGGLCDKL